MSNALPLATLTESLRGEISNAAAGEVAVLAGHYAIFSSGAAAVDLLADGAVRPRGAGEMTAFTAFTWSAAVNAIAGPAASRARLVVLVDDVQFVRPSLEDRAAAERLAAALANSYLANMRTIPDLHSRVLRERAIDAGRILRHDSQRWVFSERELRAAAVAHVRQRAREPNGASAGLTASADLSRIDVTLPDGSACCLVHSGHTNCAGGYLELLNNLYERGIRTLLALVPMRCLGPVTLGTTLAHHLYGLRGMAVITIAVPDVATGADAAVVREYGA